MSVRIKRSDLTSAHVNLIKKYLCIYPEQSFGDQSTKSPINFYIVENDYINLPYIFSSSLFSRNYNFEKTYETTNIKFTGSLREQQILAIDEALKQILSYGGSLLALYPGFGKTIVAAYLQSRLNLITLVLCHRNVIKSQWVTTFKNFTDAKIWVVGEEQPEKYDVIISMDTQFSKISSDILVKIGFLVVDEGHVFCTPGHVQCLLGTQPKYIAILTATPNRSDGMNKMLDCMVGMQKVERKSNKAHFVIRVNTGIKPTVKTNARGDMDWGKLVQDLCDDQVRNGHLMNLTMYNPKFKICILTWRKKHATQIHNWLLTKGESVALLAGSIKSYSDSRILVGTISKIGTGFDEQSACFDFGGIRINMLILAGTIKNVSLIEQTLGRAFRSNLPYIVILTDDNPSIKRHWYAMKKWCKEHGGTIKEVDYRKSVEYQIDKILEPYMKQLNSGAQDIIEDVDSEAPNGIFYSQEENDKSNKLVESQLKFLENKTRK